MGEMGDGRTGGFLANGRRSCSPLVNRRLPSRSLATLLSGHPARWRTGGHRRGIAPQLNTQSRLRRVLPAADLVLIRLSDLHGQEWGTHSQRGHRSHDGLPLGVKSLRSISDRR